MFPQIFGKYMLEREIAAGGMARVYLATLRGAGGFEKRLVVKQIRPELASDPGFVERFVKEAKTAVELSHPNIVPVYELGVEQGVYFISMEHCDGATLSELLTATGPLDAEEGAYLGVEVCRALDYAHRRAQVIHRDVTPRNVLVDEEGAIRLIDFGIAAPVADSDQQARSEVFGSPGHMPPEQLLGGALTPATDVFAVGVLLYEVLTGRPAFRRSSAKASRDALQQPPPGLESLAERMPPLGGIVAAAMRLDERERPQSAEALARPLREFLRSADAGDVARRLGDRVRAERRRGTSSSPWLVGEGLTGVASWEVRGQATPATPATPGPSTRTFATSASFTKLTRRLESEPPPRAEPSSDEPPPAATRASTRRLPSSQPPAPFEPVERTSPPAENAARPPVWRRSLLLGLVVTLPLVGVAAFSMLAEGKSGNLPLPSIVASGRQEDERPQAEPRIAQPATPLALSVATPPEKAEKFTRAGLVSAAVPRPSVALEAGSAVAPAPALLSLTALPGTQVSVAGHQYAVPVSGLSLPAGRYQVTFNNVTWDGPVSTQIVLLPGKSSRVHADFTNEPPRIVVR